MAREDGAIVKAILDEQVAAKRLVDRATADTGRTTAVIIGAIQKVILNRSKGRLNIHQAKLALREIWMHLMLAEFTKWVGDVQKLGNKSVRAQLAAIHNYGRPLTTVAQIRSIDVQTHAAEAKGLGDGADRAG